jgi:hypothetical protein
MKEGGLTKIVAVAVIVYFLVQLYKEYAKNQAVRNASQMEYDKLANQQYIEGTKPKEYKDWEIYANAILDHANLFGFR